MRTISHKLLGEIVHRIVAALRPQAIYLYGSHAYGQPHKDSDLDLLIVVRDSSLSPRQRTIAAYRALRGLFLPVEIKVITEADFEKRVRWVSSIERVVKEKGKVLYGSHG